MKLLTLLIFLLSLSILSLADNVATEAAEEAFVCDPPREVRHRVNENCIRATDRTINYRTEQSFAIQNGTVYFTSETNDHGQTILKISHRCNGQNRSAWTRHQFCGYQTMQVDRVSDDVKALRASLAKEHHLSEVRDRAQIDRLVAEQLNPFIADPKANLREENGMVTITILKNMTGATCIGPQVLRYETRCRR